MPDLPSASDRVNDIEVSANAPITEALHRKYGSNINFLLDFLGVADGETTPSGTLTLFVQALDLVFNHQIELIYNVPATDGVLPVGTYTTIPFVDIIIYTDFSTITEDGAGLRSYFQHQVDGNGIWTQPGGSTKVSTTNPFVDRGLPNDGKFAGISDTKRERQDSSGIGNVNGGGLEDFAPPVPGERAGILDSVVGETAAAHRMNNNYINRLHRLSWRDGLSHELRFIQTLLWANGGKVWLGYDLNLTSAPLTF